MATHAATTLNPRTAADRLAEAKDELRRVEQQIDMEVEHRRAVLVEFDAKSAVAARADRRLAALRSLRLRLIDQLDLLPVVAAREQSAINFPETAAGCQKRLADLEQRHARLASIRRTDLSAAQDSELDSLVCWIGNMKNRIAFLSRYETASREDAA